MSEWGETVIVGVAGGLALAVVSAWLLLRLARRAGRVDRNGWVLREPVKAPHPPERRSPWDLCDPDVEALREQRARTAWWLDAREAERQAAERGDFDLWAIDPTVTPPHELPPAVRGRTGTEEV